MGDWVLFLFYFIKRLTISVFSDCIFNLFSTENSEVTKMSVKGGKSVIGCCKSKNTQLGIINNLLAP